MERIFIFFDTVLFARTASPIEEMKVLFGFLIERGGLIYLFVDTEEKGRILKEKFEENNSFFVVIGKKAQEEVVKQIKSDQKKEPWRQRMVFPVGARIMGDLLLARGFGFTNLIHITTNEHERNTTNPFGMYRILVGNKLTDIVEKYSSLH